MYPLRTPAARHTGTCCQERLHGSRLKLSLLCFCALVLAGCESPDGSSADEFGAALGDSGETRFVISLKEGQAHARDLAGVARVLRRYKRLDAAEQALIRSRVAQRLDGLVALEVDRIAQQPQYRAARAEIRRIPNPAVAARKAAELDASIRAAAMRSLRERLGGLVATTVTGPDNKSAVAFARISGDGVKVEPTAWELDRDPDSLREGDLVARNDRTAAAFIGGPAIKLPQGGAAGN